MWKTIAGIFLGFVLLAMIYTYQAKQNQVLPYDEYIKQFDKFDRLRTVMSTSEYLDSSENKTMQKYEQLFVNFYALGCRLTGYLGPMVRGYFDADKAVRYSLNAGCRVFVLDIDYLDDCYGESLGYFPRIVVRDVHRRFMIGSEKHHCNSPEHSNIKDVCDAIQKYAFTNTTDPIVLVLYFLRTPTNSKKALKYYSHVARSLAPLQDRMYHYELEGGTFTRQAQESRLLRNKITDYQNKALIFSNADTSGFRGAGYDTTEDLDYMINLRLYYTQTQLGITTNKPGSNTGTMFGILEPAEDYLIIPEDRTDEIIENTKLRWTICLPQNPSVPVTKEVYKKITETYGVNCIPMTLFDPANEFMFGESPLFKQTSYTPKPDYLRYINPVTLTVSSPTNETNSNKGLVIQPKVNISL